MILVDVAHGKPRHVPYRDSKLTFLLQVSSDSIFSVLTLLEFFVMVLSLPLEAMQDSLGGNSKTMIIANVSPSIWLVLTFLSALLLINLLFFVFF